MISSPTEKELAIQAVKSAETAPVPTAPQGELGDFGSVVKSLLAPNAADQTNEEELFAALIGERIRTQHGESAFQSYQESLESHLGSMRRSDGYVSYEDAANAALQELTGDETLSEDAAASIKAQSFEAAQLDDNLNALYDGRGSAEDPTVAVRDLESALLAARTKLLAFDSGEETPEPLDPEGVPPLPDESDTFTPGGNGVDLTGFLFKPESESDRNAVILLPTALTGEVAKVLLTRENGEEIEEGRFTGVANGDREHYRFSLPGDELPPEVVVELIMKDGTKEQITIENPGERFEG